MKSNYKILSLISILGLFIFTSYQNCSSGGNQLNLPSANTSSSSGACGIKVVDSTGTAQSLFQVGQTATVELTSNPSGSAVYVLTFTPSQGIAQAPQVQTVTTPLSLSLSLTASNVGSYSVSIQTAQGGKTTCNQSTAFSVVTSTGSGGTSCTLSAVQPNILVGQSVSFTISSSPAGLQGYIQGDGITTPQNEGTTPTTFSQPFNSTGAFARQAYVLDSANNKTNCSGNISVSVSSSVGATPTPPTATPTPPPVPSPTPTPVVNPPPAPGVTLVLPGETTAGTYPTTASVDATVTFNLSGSAVSALCSLDGGAYSSCTSPHQLLDLSPAQHTLSIEALDASNNTSAAASTTWIVSSAINLVFDSTASVANKGLELHPGQRFKTTRLQLMVNSAGALSLTSMLTGNVVAFAPWTGGDSTTYVVFQTDGNFVMYAAPPATGALHMSGAQGAGSKLALQTDGNMCINGSWCTATSGK